LKASALPGAAMAEKAEEETNKSRKQIPRTTGFSRELFFGESGFMAPS
jgi:hypothetical protein